jgi:hypothetical protein
MDPIYMTRSEVKETLAARRRTVKPDLKNPRMRFGAMTVLATLDRRLRSELKLGARRRTERHPLDYLTMYETRMGSQAHTTDGGYGGLIEWIAKNYGRAEADRVDKHVSSGPL